MLDEISDLKERWFEIYDIFSDLRDTRLASVVRWEWANGPRYDPRPFYFKRDTAKGRLLKRELPQGERDDRVWKHGYDDQERIVLSRSDNGQWETLFSFEDEFVEMTRYQIKHKLLRGISRVYFRDNHPSHFISFMLRGDPYSFHGSAQEIWRDAFDNHLSFGVDREEYQYADDLLTQIVCKHWEQGWLHDRQEFTGEWDYHLAYDMKGALDRITSTRPSLAEPYLVYQKRTETLPILIEHTKAKLIEWIPEVVRKANFTEPLYCLKLQYMDTDLFPPTLLPGFESRRQHILKTYQPHHLPGEIWATVWDFDDTDETPYPPFPIEDEDTLTVCERLQAELIRGAYTRYRQGVRALYQVAKALNQLDWSAYAPVTSDFIVFAYDQEGLRRALRSSGATSDQIMNWRKQGLL